MRVSDWSSDVCSADLGEVRQFPHRDQDMWRGADGTEEYLVNVLWPLTPFTKENGATRIFPKSHGVKGMAKSDLGQPIFAECKPGAAICFLVSTPQGAGPTLKLAPARFRRSAFSKVHNWGSSDALKKPSTSQ